MPTNVYFDHGNTNEQRLYEDLIIEQLKIFGHEVHYLPRTTVTEDKILGEVPDSKYTEAFSIEMYIEDVNGFAGQGDLIGKFGLEVRDQATFVMAKRRWEDMVQTSGGTFTQTTRPSEGDLIYFEKTKSIFEIKYVDFQNPFYQLNQIYVYRLVCELFEYSSEDLDTGITTIDSLETKYSQDMLEYQMLQEDGTLILNETNGSIIKEEYSVTQEPIDNADFDSLVTLEGILDFSEKNPFGEIGA